MLLCSRAKQDTSESISATTTTKLPVYLCHAVKYSVSLLPHPMSNPHTASQSNGTVFDLNPPTRHFISLAPSPLPHGFDCINTLTPSPSLPCPLFAPDRCTVPGEHGGHRRSVWLHGQPGLFRYRDGHNGLPVLCSRRREWRRRGSRLV